MDLEAGNDAVTGAAYFGICDMVASVSGGDVVFSSALNPLYGSFELLCDDAADHFFGVEV